MSRRIERMTPPAPKRQRGRVYSISVSRRAGWMLDDEAARTGRSMTAIVEEIILARLAKFEAAS